MTRENPSSGTARHGSTSEGDQVLWQVLWIDWKEWLFRFLPAVWPEGDEQEREAPIAPAIIRFEYVSASQAGWF